MTCKSVQVTQAQMQAALSPLAAGSLVPYKTLARQTFAKEGRLPQNRTSSDGFLVPSSLPPARGAAGAIAGKGPNASNHRVRTIYSDIPDVPMAARR